MGYSRGRGVRFVLVGVAVSVGLLVGPVAGNGLAAVQARADVLPDQNSNSCVVGGDAPCWAVTEAGAVFYDHSGGSSPWGAGVVVDITCYYFGTPVVNGDNVEDHISTYLSTEGHYHEVSGHIPDASIDLGGHNPWDDNIPEC